MRIIGLIAIVGALTTSCVTTQIPIEDYTIAKAAYDAATAAEAVKYAPQMYFKMEKSFKRAEHLFKERYYSDARKEFQKAQKLAERTETMARLKQFTAGGESDE